MAEPRKRRIVRRVFATCATAAVLFVGAAVLRGPSVIERSRAIRIGMSVHEVESAMGGLGTSFPCALRKRRWWWCYGQLAKSKHFLKVNIDNWFGYEFQPVRMDDFWPVRIQLDENDRVVRIERGDEVAETAP